MNKETIIYDDYNSRIPKDQDAIGTLTTNIGSSTPRNGIKLIEVERTDYAPCATRGRSDEAGVNRQRIELNNDTAINALTTVQKDSLLLEKSADLTEATVANFRIRKLTPRECFRLMGVDDADIDKIQAAGISNTQQYKMAGNSIVVDNLFYIFRNLFIY